MRNYTQPLVRKALKLMSSNELQKRMGAAQPTISRWATGKMEMSYSRGKKLERIVAREEAK